MGLSRVAVLPVVVAALVAAVVLGGLLPGQARWARAQAQAPADGWIVWESSRQDGRSEVYRARADGSEVTRLTRSGGLRPLWSPDGRWIAYGEPTGAVLVMRPDGSQPRTLTATGWPFFWQHDNGGLVVAEGATHFLYDPESGSRERLFDAADFPAFAGTSFQPNALTHDNRFLLLGSHLYMNGYSGTNGSFRAPFAAVAVDLLHKDRVYFLGTGCWPFAPPEGDLVYHICGEGADPACRNQPDVMRLHLADLATRASYQAEISHPDPDWGHEYNPRVSSDGQWIVYMSSTGCHDGAACDYEIFLHPLGGDHQDRLRVTTSAGFDGYPDMYRGTLWQPSSEPRLLLTPGRHTIFASAGGAGPARLVRVKNGGGGSLGDWQVTSASPWLQITRAAEGFQIALRPGVLAGPGRHLATVVVSAAGVADAVTLPVTAVADETFPDRQGDGGEAGVEADGGTAADGGPTGETSPDSGASGTGDGGGCGCRLGGATGPAAPVWVLVAMAGLLARARRRRSR